MSYQLSNLATWHLDPFSRLSTINSVLLTSGRLAGASYVGYPLWPLRYF